MRRSCSCKIIQKCSFVISGSIYESFGISLLEAASCGKPVIAMRCVALPEIIKHGETGICAKA